MCSCRSLQKAAKVVLRLTSKLCDRNGSPERWLGTHRLDSTLVIPAVPRTMSTHYLVVPSYFNSDPFPFAFVLSTASLLWVSPGDAGLTIFMVRRSWQSTNMIKQYQHFFSLLCSYHPFQSPSLHISSSLRLAWVGNAI